MRVQVFRHGQSLSNAGGRTDDPGLIPLTQLGEAQSRALAQSLAPAPDLLVVSPYLRAVETARPIRERFPQVKVEIWPIQEFTYLAPAACVGTSRTERQPWINAYWSALDPESIDGPDAENFRSLLARATAFLARLAEMEVAHVVAITHGQFMQATRLLAERPGLGADDAMREFVEREAMSPFPNCGLLELARVEGRIVLS
jgi:broad specificity phosphatase PhoE